MVWERDLSALLGSTLLYDSLQSPFPTAPGLILIQQKESAGNQGTSGPYGNPKGK